MALGAQLGRNLISKHCLSVVSVHIGTMAPPAKKKAKLDPKKNVSSTSATSSTSTDTAAVLHSSVESLRLEIENDRKKVGHLLCNCCSKT